MPLATKLLAGLFAVSGTIHLVKPEFYEPLMPSWVPAHREVIYGSGVAEILLAAGLAVPATRCAAGWGSVVLLLAVFPGNIKMTLDAFETDNTGMQVGSAARLPLQLPLLWVAYRAARPRSPERA